MAEKLKLTIVTPDREFYKDDVDMVEFNTTEGEIGIYQGHAPLSVIVKPGILAITQGETVKNAALHAGFVLCHFYSSMHIHGHFIYAAHGEYAAKFLLPAFPQYSLIIPNRQYL